MPLLSRSMCLALCCIAVEVAAINSARSAEPLDAAPLNIVFLIADDLGVMDTTPYNPDSFYETPHLQALAESGTRFTNGYAACPVCSPTRSAVMTGQWPARTRNTDYFGAPNQFFGQALPDSYEPTRDGSFGRHADRPLWPAPYLGQLASSHTTLAEALKAHGYATFFAGKWHLGPEGSWPEDHGFDVNRGGIDRGGPYGGDKYFSPYGNPRLEDGPAGEHLPARLAEETATFIGEHADQPFLAYLSFYSVHTPLMAPEPLVEKYRNRKQAAGLTDAFAPEPPRENRTTQAHAVYAGMVEAMDAAVGRVMAALEEHGVADRTLVIFTSDNGGLSTSEGSPTSNLPFRAGKGWLYEGGIREPVLVRWPGVTEPGSTSAWPVTSTDHFPTILEAAGLPALPQQHCDGHSYAAALRDHAAAERDRPLFWHYPHWGNQGGTPGAAVRLGNWKLIEWYWGKEPELFDLADDPGEQTNLAAEHPEKAAELQLLLANFRRETNAVMPDKNPAPQDPFTKW
ncbi:MAG: sulfatase [Pirellulales bacterium]